MMKKLLVALLFLFSWNIVSQADSPLTSTDFAEAYSSSPMVMMAKGVQGDIPTALLSFLADSKAPIDERLAVVNQLGWDIEGTTIDSQFYNYLERTYKIADDSSLVEELDAGTLAVYAYAMAMSDYFDVSHASWLGHQAVAKNESKSFSVAMISALIDAQDYLSGDWSMVYKVVADVVADKTLRRDMKREAIDIIMEYINLYKD